MAQNSTQLILPRHKKIAPGLILRSGQGSKLLVWSLALDNALPALDAKLAAERRGV
jgi:hypothetical protein